jgi:LytS/YehU family sensor histidine kinase
VQEQGRIVRQQLASAQLLAIQARVDPQLLFDMLATVKRYYERDAARAEQLLDELSDFLRAALPRLRSARSTLEVEFGLVQRYLRLLRGAGAAPVELAVELPARLATAAFPAGVLLPLLAGAAGPARCVALDAGTHEMALRVCLSDTNTPAEATLERLRRSLSALYGERANLQLRPQGRGARIEMELPLERD